MSVQVSGMFLLSQQGPHNTEVLQKEKLKLEEVNETQNEEELYCIHNSSKKMKSIMIWLINRRKAE